MTRAVGGANNVMYVNVNTVANESRHAAPPCDILAFESLIRSSEATPNEPSTFVGFHAFRIGATTPRLVPLLRYVNISIVNYGRCVRQCSMFEQTF